MCSELFRIGKVAIHGYGLMIAIGVVAALFLSLYRAKRKKLSGDVVESLFLLVLIIGFLGAKLLFVIVNFRDFLAAPMSVLGTEGFVVYGGIITGALTVLLYCRVKKLSFAAYFDLLMPSVALAQGFGRLGCLMAGCCYGAPTDSALGIVFPEGALAPAGVSLWPTQIFSAGADFVLCAILLLYARKPRHAGNVGALYLLLYGLGRPVVELFRADARGAVGALSTSQFISVFIVLLSIALFILNKKRAEKAVPAETEPEAEPAEEPAEAPAEEPAEEPAEVSGSPDEAPDGSARE